jgi:DNA polymerase II small subunit/DNA polymerase delta subunit B
MKKREIVNLFLQKGYFLEERALDFLFENPEKINLVLEKAKKIKENLISLDLINSFFKKISVEIVKEYKKKEKNKISPENLHNLEVEKFDKLKEILEENKELEGLISISKINNKLRDFSLIVNLIEKNENDKSLLVEDLTGSTTIYFISNKFEKINPGDVIGVKCRWENDKILATELFYPDVPLRKDIAKTYEDVNCLFISNPYASEENFKKEIYEKFLKWIKEQQFENFFVFIFNNFFSEKEKIVEFLNALPKNSFKIVVGGEKNEIEGMNAVVNNPCILKIGEVKILLLELKSQPNSNPREFLLETLKKRYIKLGLMDYFIIDTIPDLFVCSGLEEVVEFNYKGITFLSIGNFISQPIFWMINLATRETIKIDLS